MNTKIREKQLKQSPETIKALRASIKAIKNIQKKYGDKVHQPAINQIIKKTDQTTHQMLTIIIQNDHYNTKDIQSLYQIIKKAKELYDTSVEVKVPKGSDIEPIEHKHGKVESKTSQQIGISIKTKGKIYKRELNTDIKKMLS